MDNAASTTDLLAGFVDIEALCQRFSRREASVGIVGLGDVGLPLALAAATEGFQTIGLDIDPYKVEALNAGHSYIRQLPQESVAQPVEAGRLQATSNFHAAGRQHLVQRPQDGLRPRAHGRVRPLRHGDRALGVVARGQARHAEAGGLLLQLPAVGQDRPRPVHQPKRRAVGQSRDTRVAYHNPHIPEIRPSRAYPHLAGHRSLPLTPETLAGFDAALIVTDHDGMEYEALIEHARLGVDTRGVVQGQRERVLAG